MKELLGGESKEAVRQDYRLVGRCDCRVIIM